MNQKPVIGLTMGDPAGIGPEICMQALGSPVVRELCTPVLFGDMSVLRRVRDALSSISRTSAANSNTSTSHEEANGRIVSMAEFGEMSEITEPLIVDCARVDAAQAEPARISADCGRMAFACIEHAIRAALDGRIDGVVTAPIHKESLHLAGIEFPGHTEIFASLTGARRSCMMLYSDALAVSMATTHIGYTDVPRQLSAARVLDVIELTAETMRLLRQREPRLGVCGLNPHAGEHGLFGNHEEENVVAPAVAQARAKGLVVTGPLVPDAAFTRNQRENYDAMVALYHDQGHIPFKMLAFDTGVNITLGLPIIRTSVDHGTAFDIAWRGRANPQSLFSAIEVAARLVAGKLEGVA